MAFLRPFANAMGIDVSDQVLRMVQLHQRNRGYTVHSVSSKPVPPGVIVEGEMRDPAAVAGVLRELVKKPFHHHPSSRAAVLCLPERKTFTKIIEVPNVNGEAFTKALQEGFMENIPMKLDEVYLDWQYVNPPTPAMKTVRVIVGVAPQLLVEGYLEACRQASIIPFVLEPESAALSRVVVDATHDTGSHLIIDLGATRTGLTITEQDLVAFSSTLPLSGMALTQTLQDKLGLTAEEAEQAKRICGFDQKRGKGAVRKVLEPEFRPLFQRILETIGYYEDHAPSDAKVQDITLVGGGANMPELAPFIASTTSLPVRVGAWPTSIHIPKREMQGLGTSFLTACGLALRGVRNVAWSSEQRTL